MTLLDGLEYRVEYLRDGVWCEWARYCYLGMAWDVAVRESYARVMRVVPSMSNGGNQNGR
jgi:hypothetical protein